MKKSLTKFKNYSSKMEQAMLQLLEHKEFAEISVTEICKTAGVNRSTFYDHYQNTYELLKETQKNIFANFTKTFYDAGINFPDLTKADNLFFITPKYLVPYLEYVRKNKRIFTTYMQNLSTFEPEETYGELFKNVFKPVFSKLGVFDDKVMQYMSRFFLSGITAIVNEWVKRDCNDSVELIVNIITDCIKVTK